MKKDLDVEEKKWIDLQKNLENVESLPLLRPFEGGGDFILAFRLVPNFLPRQIATTRVESKREVVDSPPISNVCQRIDCLNFQSNLIFSLLIQSSPILLFDSFYPVFDFL